MTELHHSPESVRHWAETIWPCALPDHESLLAADGWCGGCGRAVDRSLLESKLWGAVQGTWQHEGVVVAVVVNATLYVHQESYEKAIEG